MGVGNVQKAPIYPKMPSGPSDGKWDSPRTKFEQRIISNPDGILPLVAGPGPLISFHGRSPEVNTLTFFQKGRRSAATNASSYENKVLINMAYRYETGIELPAVRGRHVHESWESEPASVAA